MTSDLVRAALPRPVRKGFAFSSRSSYLLEAMPLSVEASLHR